MQSIALLNHMNIKNIVNVRKQANSFKSSFHGLKVAFLEEQSFKIQTIVALVLVILMFSFELHNMERAVLVLSISFVLGLELLNSQIERALDTAQFDHNPKIKDIKDLSASAVLVASVGALAVGLFVFLSHI